MIGIETHPDSKSIEVHSPYHPDFPSRARDLGGKWNSRAELWSFDARDEEHVRALLRDIYGSDGSGEEVATVTVRHRVSGEESDSQSLFLFGRQIISKASRDSHPRLGQGVVIIEGGFPSSSGSRNYPTVGGQGTILEIRDVPASLVPTDDPDNTWIVGETDSAREALVARIAELEAELVELRIQLAGL